MKKENFLKRAVGYYNHLEEYLLIGSLVFNVLLVFLQVVMRTVFKNSLSWSEELSRYIFIWQIWLGASIALKEEEHIQVTLLYTLIKNKKFHEILQTLAHGIWFLFCLFLVFNGKDLVVSMLERNAKSSGLGAPLFLVYSVFPLASALVCVRLVPRLVSDVKHIFGVQTKDSGENRGNEE